MNKIPKNEKKANCRYCIHAGEVVNFICDCSVLGIRRSTGIRNCQSFVLDSAKYNQHATGQQKKKECHNSWFNG